MTRFFDFLTIFVYVSDDNFTLLRLSWSFLQFVYIGDVLIAFNHFTFCWVCWLEVTLVIYFTNCVVTSWYQFVSLTFEFNLLWTVVYHCVIVFIHWLSFFVGHIWLDGLAFCINVVYIDITLHFFIDVSDGWFWFVNFTFNWIRWFQVSIFVNFTYWVVTFWYDLIGLTIWCLDSIWFLTFLSGVIWCVIWRIWCILTRFFDFLTIFVYVCDDDFTLLRLSWLFFKLVDICNILIFFSYFTSCWIWWCKVSFVINFTYCVVTRWYQFISLTVFFDFFWTVVYYCIVIFIDWLFIFIFYWIFDSIAFSIFIVNINITLRLCWLLFKFVDVCYILIFFSYFTSCWIWWCKVSFVINFTYCVVTRWYQFISLTVFFDFFWTVVYYCIVIFIDWLFIFIFYWIFDSIALSIFIVNIDITLRFFFQFVDVGDILIILSNFSSCRIWRLQVSLVIYFTNCVVTSRGQLVSLTFELNLIRTIIYNCIVGLINWLIFFISYIFLDGLAFCILIMHVNISFNIRLNKVVVYISWWFNRSWNWVVVWEWWITLQFRVYFTIWCCWVIRNRSFCLDFWNFTSNDIVTVVTSTRRCQWCAWSTFEWTWISV